jgi:CDGSH-type Zn-finger protein
MLQSREFLMSKPLSVTVFEKGPMKIIGEEERQVSDRATLCRCGLSKNKPWCDGQHKKRDGFR